MEMAEIVRPQIQALDEIDLFVEDEEAREKLLRRCTVVVRSNELHMKDIATSWISNSVQILLKSCYPPACLSTIKKSNYIFLVRHGYQTLNRTSNLP